MSFDAEGHCLLKPSDLQQLIVAENYHWIINGILLKSTPTIFNRREFFELCDAISAALCIHPNNIVVRGSSLLGYSLNPESLWRQIGPDSDIDLSIIDPEYYQLIDHAVWNYDQFVAHRDQSSVEFYKSSNRKKLKRFNYYRHFDLPNVAITQSHNEAIKQVIRNKRTINRSVSAFIFRDWWSFYGRCKYELIGIRDGLMQDRYPQAETNPFAYSAEVPLKDRPAT